MAWRYHGHARVNSRSPRAAGVCDRCGRMFNWQDLSWQWDWAGEKLINLKILVCDDCYDVPQEQLRARILTPDPLPIINARPEPFAPTGVGRDQTDFVTLIDGAMLATMTGLLIIRANEPLGR